MEEAEAMGSIDRRGFVRAGVCAATVMGVMVRVLVAADAASRPAPPRFNLLFIITDQ